MKTHKGYTLIEVLIGVVIFALGMMALVQLQGNLAKGSSNANARTVAMNIAEETIEELRSFEQITSSTTVDAYMDIVDATSSETRGGITYAVVVDVTDYWYSSGNWTTTKPTGALESDMKRIELSVTWNDNQKFQIDETNSTGNLGTGKIEMSDIISSIPSTASGRANVGGLVSGTSGPPVDYSPGSNPDIVSIQLASNKFKESTTPLPDVIRGGKGTDFAELVETRFDVVTYSQDNEGATFLRREEFLAVSCECTLKVPSTGSNGGFRPTVWNGNDYTEGEYVSKPYGESASSQQSQFCDLCCRDHHDGGVGTEDVVADPGRSKYNPWRSGMDYVSGGSFNGDHKHYDRGANGSLVEATSDGDRYIEACRMVRKDGFWRVAQDLRQEQMFAFPASFLDDDTEVGVYSSYVTTAVSGYEYAMGPSANYESSASPITMPEPGDLSPSVSFPASTPGTASTMVSGGTVEQQLRSRGIYIDYMTDELRQAINCLDDGGDGETCNVPNVTTALEIIPFYDVQLTWLARWNESPNNNPVDVTNDAISDENTHSRGWATLESGSGYSTVSSAAHRGNLGLTGTDPVDPNFAAEEEVAEMYVLASNGGTAPPPLSGINVSGTITSSVPGLKAADVEIYATDAQCDRTSLGFECVIESDATNPEIKISNYFKQNTTLVACSSSMAIDGGHEHYNVNGVGNWTTFVLPLSSTTQANIVIKQDGC